VVPTEARMAVRTVARMAVRTEAPASADR